MIIYLHKSFIILEIILLFGYKFEWFLMQILINKIAYLFLLSYAYTIR